MPAPCLPFIIHVAFNPASMAASAPRRAAPAAPAARCGGSRAASSPTTESGKLHTLVVPSFIDVFWQQFPD